MDNYSASYILAGIIGATSGGYVLSQKYRWHSAPRYYGIGGLGAGIGWSGFMIDVADSIPIHSLSILLRLIGAGVMSYSIPALIYFTYFENKTPVPEPEPPVTPPQPEPEPEPPWQLNDSLRTSHHLILGGSGHGKSQLIQWLFTEDLKGPSTTIVMDSQGDMIEKMVKLNITRDRIVYIDPTDIEYPLALNLFDVGTDRINQYSMLERETQTNGVIELLSFTLDSLLGTGLTPKQGVAFRYVIRLLLLIPDANIHTLRRIFSPGGFAEYAPFASQLPESAQEFFKHEFNSKAFEETKQQVVRRIYGIVENQAFERMFSATKSKLDMFEEMNHGNKIILINTAKSLLKKEGSQLFGRFMVSLVAQATQERAAMPIESRNRVHFYIDEASPYLDTNITDILETARKYNVGLILAFQSLGQIPAELQHSIITNTAIKMVGGISGKDARALADDMHVKADSLLSVPKLSFATYVQGEPFTVVNVPAGTLEKMETRDDMRELRAQNRDRYAVHIDTFKKASPQHDDSHQDID